MDIPLSATAHSLRSGIVFVVIGLSLAALSGALMKLATESVSPVIVGCIRFSGYFLILLPIALYRVGPRAFRPPRPGIQVVRGLLMVAGNLLFIFAVTTLDYADAIAILYIYPFLMTLLAPFILQERVSAIAWLGVVGGFVGVLLVIRPGFESVDIHALFVVGTGLCFALQLLLNRKLGIVADPAVISLWGGMISAAVLVPLVPFFWTGIYASILWVLLLIPVLAAASQTLMIVAMSRTEASILAPFTYTEIISAIVFGFLIFGTIPDALSWLGIGLITLCGIVVARAKVRELQRREPTI